MWFSLKWGLNLKLLYVVLIQKIRTISGGTESTVKLGEQQKGQLAVRGYL